MSLNCMRNVLKLYIDIDDDINTISRPIVVLSIVVVLIGCLFVCGCVFSLNCRIEQNFFRIVEMILKVHQVHQVVIVNLFAVLICVCSTKLM